ncbi:MAG: phytanoyl-CoA dioxygenase family protein [Planctomycetota bacterium]
MVHNDERAAYERDGFVVVRQLLPADEFATLRAALDRYVREIVPTLPPSDAFYEDPSLPASLKQMQRLAQWDPYFADYAHHPRWRALAELLIGEEARSDGPEWFNKPPSLSRMTPPHQDNFYFNLKPSNVATLWMAIDPVDAENGALRYVPGSHLRGFRPHQRTDVVGFSQGINDFTDAEREHSVEVHLDPGDVVAHHGMTIHSAEPNRSKTRQRRAFAMVFKGVSCRRDEAGYSRYLESLREQHQSMGLAGSKARE